MFGAKFLRIKVILQKSVGQKNVYIVDVVNPGVSPVHNTKPHPCGGNSNQFSCLACSRRMTQFAISKNRQFAKTCKNYFLKIRAKFALLPLEMLLHRYKQKID